MMRTRRWMAAVTGATIGMLAGSTANADLTFLHHFNDPGSLNVNPANGDYAAGSGTASVSGTPGSTTGFFPGSTPGNNALELNSDFEAVTFSAAGNVQLTSTTSGGITVGTWFKHSATGNVNRMFIIGAAGLDDDYLQVDLGASNPNILRTQFRDGASASIVTQTATTINPTAWHYVAATVDLTGSTLTTYLFDSTGALVGGTPLSSAITVTDWNVESANITLGNRTLPDGTATQTLEEFSIDNVVLSQSEIQQRVNDMIAGNQLVIPEPGAALLLSAGLLGVAARRRRAAH